MVACTRRIAKMMEHLPFCRKFSILCIKYRIAVDSVSKFERKEALKDSDF